MKVLRAENYRRMPWKNGGGETVEIAVFPQAAGLDDFGWRISMATVATDGPFSVFPGIDRTLSILTGNGMALTIAGDEAVLLQTHSQPLAFAADVAVSATLKDGPITDLNVMTRRGAFAHHVEHVSEAGSHAIPANGDRIALIACAPLTLTSGDSVTQLSGLDTVLFEEGGITGLHIDLPDTSSAGFYLIRIRG
jgi:environmental stress-induced protein Ves